MVCCGGGGECWRACVCVCVTEREERERRDGEEREREERERELSLFLKDTVYMCVAAFVCGHVVCGH